MGGQLEGRVALVTGASRGIGRAIAQTLGEAGAQLVLVARGAEDLDECVRELSQITHVIPVRADVSVRDDVMRVFGVVRSAFGGLDILVNNVGLYARGLLEATDEELYDRIFNANVRSLYLVTQSALPYLRESRGHIVNVSSRSGRIGLAREVLFSASKFAVSGFSQALREELREDHIRVTCVYPGPVNTWSDPDPIHLLGSRDVAQAVLLALTAYPRANIDDIVINPA